MRGAQARFRTIDRYAVTGCVAGRHLSPGAAQLCRSGAKESGVASPSPRGYRLVKTGEGRTHTAANAVSRRSIIRTFATAGLAMLAINLVAGCVTGRTAVTAPATVTPSPFVEGTAFDRPDFLYGSEIGSWPMLDDRFDGHPMLDYKGSCPGCRQLARDARISVVRWGIWNVFEGMAAPSGQTAPPLPRQQFDAVVDGIRADLGAEPFIKLPPGESDPTRLFCPEVWGNDSLLALDKEVVRQAGRRVRLYEVANEPELACGYSRDWSTAGAKVGHLWIAIVPELKKHARALGFEIYVGGPAFTTTNVNPHDGDPLDVGMARAFMQAIREEYGAPRSRHYHDLDLIPSFFSFHAYGTEYVANGGARVLDAITRYGAYVDAVRAAIDQVWGPSLGPRIRIACTEWNYGADDFAGWASPDVPAYYSRFLAMLRQHGVWLANQFLLASNGNGMDMITMSGQPTPYYQAFKTASLHDPRR